MTERKKKNALTRLYGRTPVIEILLFMIEMIVLHFKQCKGMETAYKALSGQEQNELLHIAASYQPKRKICFNRKYLYGNMRQLRKKCFVFYGCKAK